jgi:hypothetical protein
MGVFLSHTTIPKAFGTPLAWQEPSDYAVPDPTAFPLSKALQTACPMHDTYGAGDFGELSRVVVMPAYEHIVVAKKTKVLYKHCNRKTFLRKVLFNSSTCN